jgi:hypothetical protein
MANEGHDAHAEDVEDAATEPADRETGGQFPFRSGPRHVAGFLAFVVVIVFVGVATGHVPTALVVGFALWLVAALVTRLVDHWTRRS